MTLPVGVRCLGLALGDLALPAMGVQVVSIRQGRGPVLEAHDDHRLGAGDTLVLSGLPEPLALAEAKLLEG